jgi:hypothetical protein
VASTPIPRDRVRAKIEIERERDGFECPDHFHAYLGGAHQLHKGGE